MKRGDTCASQAQTCRGFPAMKMLPTSNFSILPPGAGLAAESVNPAGSIFVVLWDKYFLEMKQMSLPHLEYMYTHMYFFLPPANHRANISFCAVTKRDM